VSPNDLASTLGRVLDRPVRAGALERQIWEALFRSQGMKYPLPRMRMLDGFNEGWIDFEALSDGIARGDVDLETVLGEFVSRSV